MLERFYHICLPLQGFCNYEYYYFIKTDIIMEMHVME